MSRAARVALLALVGALLALVVPIAAHAQETGAIEGVVVNGTAGAATPTDVEVVVHVLQNRAKTGEHRVRTDGAGRFRVDGLAIGPETLYFPIIEYGGVPYYPTQPIALEGPAPVSTEITVFEGTPTPDAVSFERLNMLVMGVSPTALSMMEMGAVVNAGDRTYVADPEVTGSARTLRFLLPQGATQVSPQAGLPADTLESTADGFATTDPIRPGRREIAFSYQLPYASSSLEVTRTFALPVGAFTLYVPDEVGEVVGPGMVLQGTTNMGGREYRQYVVQQVEPGAEVRFRLAGLPAPLVSDPRVLGLLVVGVAAVVLLAFLALAIRRRRVQEPAPATEAPQVPATVQDSPAAAAERLALVQAVAQLDDRYEAGHIDEATYLAQRAEQKARLLALSHASASTS